MVLDDVLAKVSSIMASIDDMITLLEYPSVSAWYYQLKAWICCDLADQLFVQWAACVILLAMALVVLWCAFGVLKNLDGLSGVLQLGLVSCICTCKASFTVGCQVRGTCVAHAAGMTGMIS